MEDLDLAEVSKQCKKASLMRFKHSEEQVKYLYLNFLQQFFGHQSNS
jgi:hypothetical protein